MQDLLSRLDILDSKISSLPVEEIARTTGFFKRSARKAEARNWLRAICLLTALPCRSYRIFAWIIGLIEGGNHSKQNVGKRVHEGLERFLREVLGRVTAKLVAPSEREHIDAAFGTFGRVVVQDSTVIALPPHMADRFPGSSNQSGKPLASMRIQAYFDLLSESCLSFSTSPFTSNDQKASADILSVARPNDLVLRDLGYSSLSAFQSMIDQGMHFLSRLTYTLDVFDDNANKIDLLERLKREKYLDIPVFIGKKAMVPARLIAVPVPTAVAAERRRKAKLNRDRRLNPSKRRMRLLSWTILITSVPAEQLDATALVEIYALRWRIETLFKAWKSHLLFGPIHKNASTSFVSALILAGLLYLAVFQCIFRQVQYANGPNKKHLISHLKLASIMQNLITIELRSIIENLPPGILLNLSLHHCRYDSRKRPNHYQRLANLSLG